MSLPFVEKALGCVHYYWFTARTVAGVSELSVAKRLPADRKIARKHRVAPSRPRSPQGPVRVGDYKLGAMLAMLNSDSDIARSVEIPGVSSCATAL